MSTHCVAPRSPGVGRLPGALSTLVVIVGLCGVGYALADGGRLGLMLIGLAALAAVFVLGGAAGYNVLLVWVVGTGAAYPFVRYPHSHPYLTFDRLLLPAALGAVMLAPATAARVSTTTRLLFWSAGSFVVLFGLRALSSAGKHSAVVTWIDGVLIPALLLVAAHRFIRTPAAVTRLCGALTIGGAVLALIGISERLVGYELASRSGGTPRYDQNIGLVRISGPYSVPEVYALAVVVCLAGTLYLGQLRRGATWFVVGPIALAEVTAIGETYFRAAWIAALAVVIAAFGFRPGKFGRLLVVLMVVAAVLLLASSQLLQDQTVTTRLGNTQNIQARLATYEQAVVMFRQQPLFGVGVDQYTNVALTLPRPEVNSVGSVPYPHNSFLGLLAEQGLVGLVPFLLLAFASWRTIRMLRRHAKIREDVLFAAALGGVGIAFLAMSLTLDMLPYGPSNNLLALVIGAAAGRLDSILAEPGGAVLPQPVT